MSLQSNFSQEHRFDHFEFQPLAQLNQEGEQQLLTLFSKGKPIYQAVMECWTVEGGDF